MGAELKHSRIWYVDCYLSRSSGYPVNSYGPHTLAFATELSSRVLRSETSGIYKTVIAATSQGASPMVDPGEPI